MSSNNVPYHPVPHYQYHGLSNSQMFYGNHTPVLSGHNSLYFGGHHTPTQAYTAPQFPAQFPPPPPPNPPLTHHHHQPAAQPSRRPQRIHRRVA